MNFESFDVHAVCFRSNAFRYPHTFWSTEKRLRRTGPGNVRQPPHYTNVRRVARRDDITTFGRLRVPSWTKSR